MQCGELLFRKYQLRGSLETLRNQISGEIDNIEENRLLNTSTEDLAKYYAEKFQLDFPKLYEDCIQVDRQEVDIDVSKDHNRYISDRSRPVFRGCPEFCVTRFSIFPVCLCPHREWQSN